MSPGKEGVVKNIVKEEILAYEVSFALILVLVAITVFFWFSAVFFSKNEEGRIIAVFCLANSAFSLFLATLISGVFNKRKEKGEDYG